jgi:hypothetical protein
VVWFNHKELGEGAKFTESLRDNSISLVPDFSEQAFVPEYSGQAFVPDFYEQAFVLKS